MDPFGCISFIIDNFERVRQVLAQASTVGLADSSNGLDSSRATQKPSLDKQENLPLAWTIWKSCWIQSRGNTRRHRLPVSTSTYSASVTGELHVEALTPAHLGPQPLMFNRRPSALAACLGTIQESVSTASPQE
jgi:hypothetical protein